MRALRNLKVLVTAILVLLLVGMAGFHYIEGWPWFDGLYMAVTTFTTIGYQEIHPLSHAGRVFNLFLIVVGVGLVFLTIGSLTQALIEFELGNFLGRRKMEREIGRLSGHTIICGAGRVGRSVAQELAAKPAAFVIVENSEEPLSSADAAWLVLRGDATREATLREAQIERAAGLVAAATTDATNIYIVLTARSLNPKLKIIARASEESAEKHLHTAGADIVISPYAFAGHRIAQSFLRPNVLDFLDIATTRAGKVEMIIEELSVARESRFAHSTVGTSGIHRNHGVIVLAIKHADGNTRFNPEAQDRIDAGDTLIVMGQPASMSALEAIAAGRS